MSAIEAMAKAYVSCGNEYHGRPNHEIWNALPDSGRREIIEDMRAAILALAEIDLPYKIINSGMEAYYKAPNTDEVAAFTAGFRAICKTLAEDGK